MKTNFKENFFYWSLCLVLITLPMPKYSLNSQGLILLFISWIFFNNASEKARNLKRQKLSFLIISSMFWISILSGLLFSDMVVTTESLVQNLPFVIIPIIVFTSIKDKKAFMNILKIFSFSVIAASLFALFKATFFKLYNLGNFFYYTDFSKLLDVHTTYFALFIVIAIVYFLEDIFESGEIKKWVSLSCILILIGTLYLVSSRISIVGLLIVCIYYLIRKRKTGNPVRNILAGTFIISVFIAIMATPNFQDRNQLSVVESYNVPDLNTRFVHWNAVLNTIKSNDILFGNGVQSARDKLIEEYRNMNFETGYLNKYNAHNQFLENTLNFGIIGLLSLIGIFAVLFYRSLSQKNGLFVLLTSVFLLFMLTESILMRHHGIISFALLASLILNNLPNERGTMVNVSIT